MATCNRCNGRGEIHLLGPNYTSCPECDGEGGSGDFLVWTTDGPKGTTAQVKEGSTYSDIQEIRFNTTTKKAHVIRYRGVNVVNQHESVIDVINYYAEQDQFASAQPKSVESN